MTIRPSVEQDAEQIHRLRRTTFGGPRVSRMLLVDRGGWSGFVAESDTGELLGFLRIYDMAQHFGGRAVPMAGVASVSVPPHARGRGIASALLSEALVWMRRHGFVLSTLFGAVPQLYKKYGWQHCGVRDLVTLRPEFLAAQAQSSTHALRAGRSDEADELIRLRNAVLSTVDGSLAHGRAPMLASQLTDADLCTVWGDPARGYLVADRDVEHRVQVRDLVAADETAAAALLRSLSSWAGQTTEIELPIVDEALHDLVACWPNTTPIVRQSWMSRVVDVAGAVEARGWPGACVVGETVIDIEVTDTHLDANSGPHQLRVGTDVELIPGGSATVRFTERGFVAWYTASASTTSLRRYGLLTGDDRHDATLDVLVGAGVRPRMADIF